MDGRNINILLSSCLAAAAAVVVLSASATRPTDRVRVELKPRDVLIATGENLTVNCTLSRAGYGSPNDLFFRVNNSLLNASLEVEVISERAAALKVTNVQRNMSGVVECHHRSLGVTPDTTHVLVADKPTKPRIRECIVHNWENMSCFWDEPEETGIETNITVCFMLVHIDTSECHPCPNPDRAGRHSCSLLKEDHRIRFLKIRYWVLIEAENKLGWDYDLIVQDPAEHPIVKPNGVQSLECVANSSQSCVALWGSPAEGEKLNYRIKFQIQNSEFKSRWDAEELVVRTNVTYVTLSNLIPSTEYQLIIDCIPLINGIEWGIWSPPELCSCRTHTDVPAMNPPVTFGAYRVLPADGHSNRRRERPVQLHWQPVPRRWSNGEITEVRVRITKQLNFPSKQHLGVTAPRNAGRLGTSVSAAGRDLTLPGSVTNATVDLDVDSTYIWTVEARTSSGYNESLLPLSVVIPKKDETPRFPKRFVVATDSTNHYYTFIDASTFPDASGYTIYWCTTSGNRPDICSSPYNWTHIRPLQAEHELHLPNHPCPSVRFQVSFEYLLPSGETVSSGMLAVDSIYSRDGVLRIPENLRFSEGAKDSESLTIRWNIDHSSYCTNSAYISHYVIRYCSTTCHETSVEGSVDVAKLTDLQPGTVYRIQLKSCSFKNQESDFTEAIVDTTSTQDSQWDKIIFAVSTATGGLVLVCLLLLCRQLKQRTRRSILIVIPKKCSLPAVEIENDGYRTPVLPITNFDPYLHPCNGALSAENSQPTRDTYPTWMTIEPGNLSSHISVPHINLPNDNSSSSSVEYSPIQYNASMCLRVLPDLCSSETQR